VEHVGLSAILERFRASHPEVEGAALVDRSGTVLVGDPPGRFRGPRSLLGMTLLNAGEWAARACSGGPVGFLVVGCEGGIVVARPVGGDRVLIIVASAEATLRLISSDSLWLARRILAVETLRTNLRKEFRAWHPDGPPFQVGDVTVGSGGGP
jgi:predicted regulator of Ras-like GTPase activity (Roadblock/LC7/MglB family)